MDDINDFLVHFKYRAVSRDGYEQWHYEHMRFTQMYEAYKSLFSKGGRQFFIRPLGTQERWYRLGEVISI